MRICYTIIFSLLILIFSCEKPETVGIESELEIEKSVSVAVLKDCSEYSTEQYLPLCKGNYWTYSINGSNLLSISSEIIEDTVVDRKRYFKSFYDVPIFNKDSRKLDLICENGKYYANIWGKAKWLIFDENAEIGDKWTVPFVYFGKSHYFGCEFSVIKKFGTYEFNDKVLNNVTEIKQEFIGGDEFSDVIVSTSTYFYAKGIGIISINHIYGPNVYSISEQENLVLTNYYVQ